MSARDHHRLYRELLDAAVAQGVSGEAAAEAVTVTRRRFDSLPLARPHRIRAYFRAVVRRKAIRDRSSARLTGRLVLEAVVDDLRATGRDDDRIREELEVGWRGRVPDAVLDEVASRLCA